MAKRVIQVIEEVADEVEAAICGLCWPAGWPYLAQTASCEHGEFVRAVPAVSEPVETTQETVPETATPAGPAATIAPPSTPAPATPPATPAAG